MTYKGIARGKTIELDESLPFAEGEELTISVQASRTPRRPGSPSAVLEVVRAEPHLSSDEVTDFERMINDARLQVEEQGPFDDAHGR